MKGMIDGIIITQHISLNVKHWLWKLYVSAFANCRLAMPECVNTHIRVHIEGQRFLKHLILMHTHSLNTHDYGSGHSQAAIHAKITELEERKKERLK